MGIKFDLLPPAQYDSGVVNWVAQSFIRIQQALARAVGGGVGTTSPTSPAAGDIFTNTTAKTLEVTPDGLTFKKVSSYDELTYTPIVSQPGAIGKTINAATYQYQGAYILGEVLVTFTGAGTGNNAIHLTLPVTVSPAQGQVGGYGYYFRATGGLRFPLIGVINGGTDMVFVDVSNTTNLHGVTGSSSNAAIAVGDALTVNFRYRWAN